MLHLAPTGKAMGKRTKSRGQPKPRHRKKPEPKRRAAPKAKARSSAAAGVTEIARLAAELKDARVQHAAMSEVLHAISRSKFELSAVLASVAEAAARLCRADGAVIFQRDGTSTALRPATAWCRLIWKSSGSRSLRRAAEP